MFQSSLSWLTTAIMMTASFGKNITRQGNTHEFYAPASVYKTADGHVYMTTGTDRQWEDLVKIPGFESLAKEEYKTNAGRIADCKALNEKIEELTRQYTTDEALKLFHQAGIPIAKVNTLPDVISDPPTRDKLLYTEDPRSGLKVTLAPPPIDTTFLQSSGRKIGFPPRWGEHNDEIYGQALGFSKGELEKLKAEGII